MPDTISSRKSELSSFPQRRDTCTARQNGSRKEHVTDAEIVNKIEAVTQTTQEHAQKTVRVAANASAGGDRKRLVFGSVLTNDRDRQSWSCQFFLSSAQLAFLGGSLTRPGTMLFPSVYSMANAGDGTPVRVRSYTRLTGDGAVEIHFDHVDPSKKLKSGTFHVKLVILAL